MHPGTAELRERTRKITARSLSVSDLVALHFTPLDSKQSTIALSVAFNANAVFPQLPRAATIPLTSEKKRNESHPVSE